LRTQEILAGALAGLLLAGPAAAVDLGDGLIRLRAEVWSVLDGPSAEVAEAFPAARRPTAAPEGSRFWLVVTEGPADDAIRGMLEADGRRVVGFVPSNGWIVRAEAPQALRDEPGVLRVEPYRSHWKVAPELDLEARDLLLHVDVFRGEDPHRVADELARIGAVVVAVRDTPDVHRVVVRSDGALVPEIAAVPAVEWIEERGTVTLRNDVVRWVIQSNVPDSVPLHDRGLFGAGQIVGHIDGSIDTSSCFFADPDHAPGPDHRKLVAWRYFSAPTVVTHGTHTAGTLAGENIDPDFPQYRGMAPKARISHTDWNALNGEEYNGQPSNVADLLQAAHDDGARLHSNSWGNDSYTTYTTWCRDIDAFSRSHEDDLVLFAVSNLSLLKTPENAKNLLAVGATLPPPNQGLFSTGGSGPTSDGRRKPEVWAPGSGTRSAAPGACATTTLSGTSMACPAVTGGALLVREYFERGFFPTGRPWAVNSLTPTGALVKALLVNSTVDMTGSAGYPGDREGWGRILLDDALYFEGDSRRLWLRDVRHAQGLGTGGVRAWTLQVEDGGQPLAITLAFMDEAASAGAALAPVNDLDLEVEGPGGLLLGNVFDTAAGESQSGGAADPLNNVERVLVSSPAVGSWTVRVRGTSVPSGPQGFAVVVNGGLAPRTYRSAVAGDLGRGDGGFDPEVLPIAGLDPFRPNPFRGGTELRFAVAAGGPASLRIYDVGGRLVRVLLDRPISAGEHRLTWDGKDRSGAPAPPGVYFARLDAPGVSRTVKGVHLR
jgi:hypothetical protein